MSWSRANNTISTVEIVKTKIFDAETSSFFDVSSSQNNIRSDEMDTLQNPNVIAQKSKKNSSEDEIYDSAFISEKSQCLAIASNSEDLCILNMASGQCFHGMGHTQSIMAVDSPDWDDFLLASGSKDNSILFWRINELKKDEEMTGEEKEESSTDLTIEQLALATGHTHSVSSVAFSHTKVVPFLVSVSHDTTLKLWPLAELTIKQEKGGEQHKPMKLSASTTIVVHTKDVNHVDISVNDKLCVTASMDKTAKLWHIDRKKMSLAAAGTLSGHKRGVWCARFSRNTQLVATCSGDCTIKLFSLLDNSCTRTLEGHQFAVLSVLFVDRGNKLVSVDGGGLLKVWDFQHGICEKTIEGHDEKIWSLQELPSLTQSDGTKPKTRFMTGSADGKLAIWEDQSEEAKLKRQKAAAKNVEDKQTLSNLLQQNRLFEALLFTLDLGQPFQCLNVLTKLFVGSATEAQQQEQEKQLIDVIRRLDSVQLSILLDYASKWNTNTRTYAMGQLVLNCILRSVRPGDLQKLPNIEAIVKGFLPYSLRHYERLKNMRKSAAHLDFAFSSMRLN